ncbi:hypothetical protein D2V93_15275 [Flagellimonas taeanensis]|nr:hypothetical protein D2V93_15275 [Allomuricauda taeanensis]
MLKSWVASDVSWVQKRRLCGKIFSVVGHNKKRPKSILDSILIGLVLFKEKYLPCHITKGTACPRPTVL